MKNIAIIVTWTLLSFATITGCTTKEQTGTLAGAVAGATIGSHIGKGSGRAVAIFFGTIIGSELGRALGQHMDEHDRRRTAGILERNQTHQRTAWRNPDTGHYYRVAPTRTYATSAGPCREFTMDAEIGDKTQQLYGTACRQADGSWKMMK